MDWKRFGMWVFLAAAAMLFAPAAPAQEADIILRGGMVLDGTGGEAARADVAVNAGRISAVGDLSTMEAARVIDVSGLYVTPGFVDIHSHGDEGLSDRFLASALNNVTQGITTVVVGQDGRHAWPVRGSLTEQTAVWRAQGVGNNVIPLVGQGYARLEVMGFSEEPATVEQARAIGERVRELLTQGAWGISTGLSYVPGRYSTTEEIIEATRPVKEIDGFYISHLRNQGDRLLESIEETIRIANETGVKVVATHLKAVPKRNWGKGRDAVELMRKARAEGVPIYGDLYPYETSSDGIDVSMISMRSLFDPEELHRLIVPGRPTASDIVEWAYHRYPQLRHFYEKDFLLKQPVEVIDQLLLMRLAGDLRGDTAYRDRLRRIMEEPEKARALLEQVEERIEGTGGAEIFAIERHPEEKLLGVALADVARAWGMTSAQAAVELTLEGAAFTQMHMSEEDIITYITQPFIAACTDGWVPEYGLGLHHPRSYGAFTRRLRRYVYELGVIDLPFAVHTATGLPAEIIGITDRGLLRAGYWADIIAFDPRRVRDRATFRHPHRFSEGIEWVLINGDVVLENGKPNSKRAGKVLLKTEAGSTN